MCVKSKLGFGNVWEIWEYLGIWEFLDGMLGTIQFHIFGMDAVIKFDDVYTVRECVTVWKCEHADVRMWVKGKLGFGNLWEIWEGFVGTRKPILAQYRNGSCDQS